MIKLRMKIAAVTAILAIAALTLTVSASNTSRVSIYLPGDVNHDGLVDLQDAALLAMSWGAIIGQPNYNPNCDFNHSGRIDSSDAAILAAHWSWHNVQAEVSIMPSTLNVKSKGNSIMCIIRLPEGVNASEINEDAIMLNGTINAQKVESAGNQLVVKFSREAVITLIEGKLQPMDGARFSVVTLTIQANLSPKVMMLGADTVRVIGFD